MTFISQYDNFALCSNVVTIFHTLDVLLWKISLILMYSADKFINKKTLFIKTYFWGGKDDSRVARGP